MQGDSYENLQYVVSCPVRYFMSGSSCCRLGAERHCRHPHAGVQSTEKSSWVTAVLSLIAFESVLETAVAHAEAYTDCT